MEAYTGFAQVYDIFMDNVPYDQWVDYLSGLLKEYGVKDGLILELGCGTGKVTRRLATLGYDMIGIDNSLEMLEIAREKEYFQESSILYLNQDMREFELYGTVKAVVSICDSMNYITSEKDLLKVFRLVNNYLDPGGLFIFDLNTEYKYRELLGDRTIAENRNDCSFIWDNFYYESEKTNEYNISIFVKVDEMESDEMESDENGSDINIVENGLQQEEYPDLFERYRETHYQKAYSIDTIKELLDQAGLEFVTVFDAFTHNSPTNKSERIYFIAKEKYQENKKYI